MRREHARMNDRHTCESGLERYMHTLKSSCLNAEGLRSRTSNRSMGMLRMRMTTLRSKKTYCRSVLRWNIQFSCKIAILLFFSTSNDLAKLGKYGIPTTHL